MTRSRWWALLWAALLTCGCGPRHGGGQPPPSAFDAATLDQASFE